MGIIRFLPFFSVARVCLVVDRSVLGIDTARVLRGCLKSQKKVEKSGQNPQIEGYEYCACLK
jgi:hypothetical protein